MLAPGMNDAPAYLMNQLAGIVTDAQDNVLFCASKTNKIFAMSSTGQPMCAVICEVNYVLIGSIIVIMCSRAVRSHME